MRQWSCRASGRGPRHRWSADACGTARSVAASSPLRAAPNGGRCSSPDKAAQLPHGRADAESRRQAAPLLCLREGAATTNDWFGSLMIESFLLSRTDILGMPGHIRPTHWVHPWLPPHVWLDESCISSSRFFFLPSSIWNSCACSWSVRFDAQPSHNEVERCGGGGYWRRRV